MKIRRVSLHCVCPFLWVFQIDSAGSVDVLRDCVIKHSTMLQVAGCLRHVSTVEEKKDIVSDYLRWYIIARNSSVIDR